MRISSTLVLPILLLARAPLFAQAPSVEVMSIEFQGNEAFPDDSLSLTIVNRETRCRSFGLGGLCPLGVLHEDLNDRELSRDVMRLTNFYNIRGYREARVDTVIVRPSEDAVELTFRIEEGSPVRVAKLTVEGADAFEDFDPTAELPIQVGGLLSGIDLAATRDTMIQRFRNRGYPRADVSRSWSLPAQSPYQADVTFEVERGPHSVFGPITLVGNEELDDGVIRRLLRFEEGEEYSEVRTLEAQRNLFSVEIIQRASIVEAVDPAGLLPDSVVALQVRITESDVHRMRVGGGWSTSDCMNAEARWTSRNFYGGARRLQIRARGSNWLAEELQDGVCGQAAVDEFGGANWLFSAEFTQPLLRQGLTFGSNVFFERQSLQDVFVRRSVGVDLSLSQTLGAYTSLTFAYRPELTELAAAEVFFCTSFLVCTPEDVSALQEQNWLAPISVSMVRTVTNSLLNPTSGYQVVLNFEHSSTVTGSEFQYDRILSQATAYVETLPGQVLAARVQWGWVGAGSFILFSGGADIIHPQKRFFSGGGNSVRGFGQDQLGPRVLTVDPSSLLIPADPTQTAICAPAEIIALTCDADLLRSREFGTPRPTGGSMVLEGGIEYRMATGRRLETAVFADFGRIWTETQSGALSRLEITPGVGIRYFSPVGPIRVDLGYQFRGEERLQVITTQIRPFGPGDDPKNRIRRTVGNQEEVIEYVRARELALLDPRVSYGPSGGLSFDRLQLHIGIGHAF
jgi:outer membrane protein insertion porin family/translocation and assembly module TamA